MKIAGIIAEYNPFHNGHAHHIRETRRLSGCDFVVACMAGSFTQRGEAACLDKWSRARAALACGADAVFELPALWAVRSADAFARGGVAILSGLGCDILSFGSESPDLSLIERLAELAQAEPDGLSEAIRAGLAAGKSHVRARGEALAEYLNVTPELLNAPNLILAVEYLRAIRELNSPMRPLTVPRVGDYHGASLDEFASASAIRAALVRGDREAALRCVPEAAREILANAPAMHAPDDLLLHTLRNMTDAQLASLPDANEGLDCRLARCARESATREELIDNLKCKRYTRARLTRLCAHALLGVTGDLLRTHPLPPYARLLGMREDARPLLKELNAQTSLPIVSDPVKLRDDPVFQLDCRATDLRALCCDDATERRAGQEFTRKFVLV